MTSLPELKKELDDLKSTMNICLENHENLIEGKRIAILKLQEELAELKEALERHLHPKYFDDKELEARLK